MNTRHAVIDSPLGELTLVADGGALIGLYFRHHWYRPPTDTFGPRVDAESDGLLAEAQAQLDDLSGRRPDRLRPADRSARRRPAAPGLASADHHPLRRNGHLRRTRRGAGRRINGPRGRSGRRPQPALDHRSVSPGRREERQADRLCGRARTQEVPARPRGAGRSAGGAVVLMAATNGRNESTPLTGMRSPPRSTTSAVRCCRSWSPSPRRRSSARSIRTTACSARRSR